MVMFHKLGLINKNQRGFTLVEIMLAILISGLIGVGITATIFQLFTGSERSSSHMTAVRQVESAGYWISHDAQMAQTVTTTELTPPEILKLDWTDPEDDKDHQVVYSLANNELQRSYSIDESPEPTVVIAQFIDSASFDSSYGGLIFYVTATVQGQTESREYQIIPRPG